MRQNRIIVTMLMVVLLIGGASGGMISGNMNYQVANVGDTLYFWFAANTAAESGDDGATPLADVREAGATISAAPTLSPTPALISHANYPAGCYELAVAATTANGFVRGKTYAVFCTLAVDGQNPTGFIGAFNLDKNPQQTRTYYIDVMNGSDSNDGLTIATAWRQFTTAIPKMVTAGGGTLVVLRAAASLPGSSTTGVITLTDEDNPVHIRMTGYQTTGELDIDNYPILFAGTAAYLNAGWSESGTYENCYQYTTSNTYSASYNIIVRNTELLNQADVDGGMCNLQYAASAANCNETEGTFWYTGTIMLIHLPGGRGTYFTNGGDIIRSTEASVVTVTGGNVLEIENMAIWGTVTADKGGKIIVKNTIHQFCLNNALYASYGGRIEGSGVRIEHCASDGLNAHGSGSIEIDGVDINNMGWDTSDQAITSHERGELKLRNVTARKVAGEIVAATQGSHVIIENFFFDTSHTDNVGIYCHGDVTGQFRNGYVTGCTKGLYVAANASGYQAGGLLLFNDITFNGQVDVAASLKSTVVLRNCTYTSTGGTNFTEILDAPAVNVTKWLGTAAATPTVAGVPEVDLTYISGDSQSMIDLKDFADAGYNPATDKVAGVVLADTVTTLTGHTAQTGDSYAIVSSGTYGNAKLVRATTPANTLSVDSGGVVQANIKKLEDSADAAVDLLLLAQFMISNECEDLFAVEDGSIIAHMLAINGIVSNYNSATDSYEAIADDLATVDDEVGDLLKLSEADTKIDKTTDPDAWRIVFYEKGTANVLMTKLIKDVDGATVASPYTVIGQQVETP